MSSNIEYNLNDLTNAIVKQAADDYRKALAAKAYKHSTPQKIIEEIERFFRSRYFELLTDVKGDFLIEKLREEYRENERKKNEGNIDTSHP